MYYVFDAVDYCWLMMSCISWFLLKVSFVDVKHLYCLKFVCWLMTLGISLHVSLTDHTNNNPDGHEFIVTHYLVIYQHHQLRFPCEYC